METFSPTNWFISVLLSTLGLPMILTKPARCGVALECVFWSSINSLELTGRRQNAYLCFRRQKYEISSCFSFVETNVIGLKLLSLPKKDYFCHPKRIYQMSNPLSLHTLRNAHGMRAEITNLGGRVVSLWVPDKNDTFRDVVLGFENVSDYLPENHRSDFGAVIGRYANRLKNGQITVDGHTYKLPQNDGPHCLHGGFDGWQYRLFTVDEVSDNRLVLSLVSKDGDSGFPGEVHARVTYTLTDDNTLDIEYEAVTDAPTVINMTNHSYFNLNGDASTDILNHLLTIDADRYTPIDETFIPTGELASVADTPMDFRQSKLIGRDIAADFEQLKRGRGYDHNWVLNTKGDDSRPCARLDSPVTGIVLEVYTTEPGMQVYTGNFLDGTFVGKGGIVYHQRAAVCLETQKFPDSPNQNWPESNAFLRPGEVYRSRTKFRFSKR